jgi:hypothetical protein
MLIDSEDRRLTSRERHQLRQIATRLHDEDLERSINVCLATGRATPLPEPYHGELDRVFGSDCEPETNRWER